MRRRRLPVGVLPLPEGGSQVTRQLCRAMYARPAHPGGCAEPGQHGCLPWGEAGLLKWVEQMLRDPARSVPSYGFDLVPVLAHGARARTIRLVRRVLLVVVVVSVLAWAPILTVLWLGALACAWVVGPSGTAWAVLAMTGWWSFILLMSQPGLGIHALHAALFSVVLGIAVALVYAVDGLAARAARRQVDREGVGRDRLPRLRRRTRARLTQVDAHQHVTDLPYDDMGRFLGAGRDLRGAVELRVPLRPARDGRPVVPLRELELLEGIREALTSTGAGENTPDDSLDTAPLPGFSVIRVRALPADLWLKQQRGGPPGGGVDTGVPDRSDREYLRAQCISWQGQLVVTLFVHTALQAGELRLTLRTQVMAPLLRIHEPAGLLAASGLRGANVLLRALWQRILKRPGPGTAVRMIAAGPVSLRDVLSLEGVPDLHQRADAERHIELMQAAVLRAVEGLLDMRGFATEAFSDRRNVINSIQVMGDNRAPILLAGGVRVTDVALRADASAVQARTLPAPTEGVFMSPGFNRPEPPSEPPGAARTGISINGGNSGTVQNIDAQKVSHVTLTGSGQSSMPPAGVLGLMQAFQADVEAHAATLEDPEALRDQAALVRTALADPQAEGFAPALRSAVRSLPQLVTGTAVQLSGEALVSAIRQLLS